MVQEDMCEGCYWSPRSERVLSSSRNTRIGCTVLTHVSVLMETLTLASELIMLYFNVGTSYVELRETNSCWRWRSPMNYTALASSPLAPLYYSLPESFQRTCNIIRMSVDPHSEEVLFASETQLRINWHFWITYSRPRESATCLVKVDLPVLMEEQKELWWTHPSCTVSPRLLVLCAHMYIYWYPSALNSWHQLLWCWQTIHCPPPSTRTIHTHVCI